MEPLSNEFQVTLNYSNPQEHVPKAEQNNCVIKERVCTGRLSPITYYQAFAGADD